MPELPEVETVVRDLRRKVVGRTITAVWTDWPKMIKDIEKQSRLHVSDKAVAHFKEHIVGRVIECVERRAKNILIYLSGDHLMLVHQKMTGHFLVGKWEIKDSKAVGISPRAIVDDPFNRYVHLIFDLSPRLSPSSLSSRSRGISSRAPVVEIPRLRDDERPIQLGLSDVRKFAKVLFGRRKDIESLPELARLGPDALDPKLTLVQLALIVLSEGRPIKQVLMDPFVIAGIGNIYSDDILWRARVYPKRSAKKLSSKEVGAIHKAMREVLTKAVKLRGTSTSDFRDTDGKEGGYTEHRLVYQRTGKPCSRCKTPIGRMMIAGRSAHFCPTCQR